MTLLAKLTGIYYNSSSSSSKRNITLITTLLIHPLAAQPTLNHRPRVS
jgi:hypothetical protein